VRSICPIGVSSWLLSFSHSYPPVQNSLILLSSDISVLAPNSERAKKPRWPAASDAVNTPFTGAVKR
jgi:hypothetical protein